MYKVNKTYHTQIYNIRCKIRETKESQNKIQPLIKISRKINKINKLELAVYFHSEGFVFLEIAPMLLLLQFLCFGSLQHFEIFRNNCMRMF